TSYWVDVVFSNVLVPTVTSITPAANATGVSTTSPNIAVTFSKPVLAGTISLTLKDSSNNTVPATFAYDSATLVASLTPSAALAPTTTYTATISGAQDSSGQTISPLIWTFTAGVPDTTPPIIASSNPIAGAALAWFGGSVTATFNEAVLPGTITFVLRESNGNLLESSATYDS